MGLLIWLMMCVAITSCLPSQAERGSKKLNKEYSSGQVEGGKTVLSKEKIIKIADRAARRHGRKPEDCIVIYDEENAYWTRNVNARGPWPELEGHDYQAVIYNYRVPRPSGSLWVLVDRNTGNVLKVIVEP